MLCRAFFTTFVKTRLNKLICINLRAAKSKSKKSKMTDSTWLTDDRCETTTEIMGIASVRRARNLNRFETHA